MKRRMISVVCLAVMMAVCIAAAVGESAAPESENVIVRAQYPEMSPYPNELEFEGKAGEEFDMDGFSKVYDAWWEDRQRQRMQEEGYQEGLEPFFAESSRQFLSDTGGENRAFSPLNIYMALGMLAELTDQNSRQQILDALGAESMEALRRQAAAVWNANYCDDGAVASVLASSLWLDQSVDFKQETMDLLAENYHASSYRGEMGSEELDRALQSWLDEQTGGLLKEQISNVGLDRDTVLALATTVYFRAKWQREFAKSQTKTEVFCAASGEEEACEFMHQTNDQIYYWGERFSAVEKSLQESGSMWFILPDEGVLAEELLTDEEAMGFAFGGRTVYNEWEKSKFLVVNLSVPKFDISAQLDLKEGLEGLGITDVFDSAVSDFSPMTEAAENVALSQAEHGARVMIDEEGCAAAAYTVMAAAGAAMPPDEEVDFVLDRPFLFVLTGNDGLPLFVGIVNHAA